MSSDDSDEDIAMRKNVQELKKIKVLKKYSKNHEMRDEVLNSINDLKSEITNNVKNESIYVEQVKKSFKKISSKIEDMEADVLKEIASLSLQEQESVATFWEISTEFITKMFGWITIKFKKLARLIKKGVAFVVKKIEKFMGYASIWLKEIFWI